jgi:Lrp/AsnC family leucine-responsive transcriptional regulator
MAPAQGKVERFDARNVRLDEVDRNILSVLQRNARCSTREIAQGIGGISKVAVAYRIKKLIRQGVIEGFTARINGNKVDRSYVIVTRVVCIDKGPRQREIADRIARISGVQSVYQIFGPYDIMVIARTRDKESARDLVYEIYKSGGIRTTNTLVAHTAVKESVEIDLTQSMV